MQRSGLAAALSLMLAAVAGCSGEEEVETKLRPLMLAEQSSSVAKTGAGHVVSWAGVLSNPNRWHFGEHTVATIVATDAAGREVVRMEQPLDAVPPSGRLPFAGETVASGEPVKVKIGYRPAQWRQAARIPSAFQPFPVTDLLTQRLDNGTYLVTGQVTDPYRKAVGSLAVTALLRNAEGRLAGGGTTFVDDVRPGARRRFVITVERVKRAVKRTEVNVGTWGSTGRPYEDLVLAGARPVHTAKPATPPFAVDRGATALPGDGRP